MTLKLPKLKSIDTDIEDVDGNRVDSDTFQLVKANEIWSYDDLGIDLSVEQALFVRSYIIDRNPVAAMRRLNYSGDVKKLQRMANKILQVTEVQEAIEVLASRMMEKLEITAEKLQKRFSEIAFFDPRSVMHFDERGLRMLPFHLWPEGAALNIKSLKTGKYGLELQLHDGMRAAELLAKQIGLQPDESSESAKAASKAAADAVMDKLRTIFDRSVPGENIVDPDVIDVPMEKVEDKSKDD